MACLPYRNTDEDWHWLQERAAKAGRWLGYVSFAAIVDQRSADPVLYHAERDEYPTGWVQTEMQVYVPPRAAIAPTVHVEGFVRQQPYQLVVFGEKASLAESVLPIAREFGADAYLETGEISDSHLYLMARRNHEDGRPLRVFTLSDFDPAGWQMPISIARKLQALRDLKFSDMDFEVHPVALLSEQVRDLELPSTPLKETERRADRWRERWGHEQTEIDALATLRPEILTGLLRDALSSFYDDTLAHRLEEAKYAWLAEAQDELRAHIDHRTFRRLTKEANQALTTFRRQITRINAGLRRLTAGVILPDIVVPDVRIDERTQPDALISSAWPWLEQTRALKARKAYE